MKKLILDLDTGIDDSMALAYAVESSDFELIGVTGTYGNVYTEVGAQNALNVLQVLGHSDVPVYCGAKHSLHTERYLRHEISAKIHGENGVGDVDLPMASRPIEEKKAVDFLIWAITKYRQDLVIVATGPLTNLALALKQAPLLKEIIGPVVIMGGALTVPGNVSPYAEANISKDPHAAKFLFESGIDLTMVGLDVTERSQLTKQDTQTWRQVQTMSGRVFADMVDYYIAQHPHSGATASYLHDPSAVICAAHPEWFTMLPMHMTVITEGEGTGRTIGDPAKLRTPEPRVKVCVGVDSEKVERHFVETLTALFRKAI
ncbi:nucleoside hydrolase [Anaerotignum lactatifermentans]|uniref:Nucleoside hydrolase n=1 Tax=Anaerotignum lactatifermentans TaxID=160404 RepID=A0ABS2GAP1_9FIRM|nr:nucleoside hydrolase [Anaerotignum lactatifermentans]MBM6828348.1 nucleoside hydrolase [Anaerotignum lactatifermentans]MBM6877628.1 nucleoside hydrolase [Anaerotignum lactatifermentans]MBM6949931.1 nucleoside hydrolase [Anaerotignum lactatifermentans]